MEELCGYYLKHPSEKNAKNLLNFSTSSGFFNLSISIGKYMNKLYPYDAFFVGEIAKASFYAKKYLLSYKSYSKLLKYTNKKEEIDRIIINRKLSLPYIINTYIDYNDKKIKTIKEYPLNITSFVINCGSYEKTINSFINCCLDVHKIDKWFFVDDKLTDDDKINIKEKYPFFTFINDIDQINTEYVIYIERECYFYSKSKYIEQCMSVLYKTNTGQCLINKCDKITSTEKSFNYKFYYYTGKSERVSFEPSMYKLDTLKMNMFIAIHQSIDTDSEKMSLINQIPDNGQNISGNHDIDLYKAHTNLYYKNNNNNLAFKIGCFLLDNHIKVDSDKLKSNQLFYIKSLENVRKYTLTEPFINVDNPKDEYTNCTYNVLNPSMYKDENDDIWVNIRHVSFDRKGSNYIPMSLDQKVKTKNTFGKLDKTSHTLGTEIKEIKDCAEYPRIDNRVLGFEDMKIFKFKNRWCFTCTSYESSSSTDVLFGRLDINPIDNIWETHDVIPLRGDMVSPNRPEKNWMPILDGGNSLRLVYSTFPLHIVTLDEENKKVISSVKTEWSKSIGDFRGSSCLIPYKDGYIYIIHEVYYKDGNRNYIHRFVWLSNNLDIMKYSNPFFMDHENQIEYCNGLVHNKENNLFYISYGSNDKKAMLLTIPDVTVDNHLIENTLIRKQTYDYSCFIDDHYKNVI
jgi:hypothetical protein